MQISMKLCIYIHVYVYVCVGTNAMADWRWRCSPFLLNHVSCESPPITPHGHLVPVQCLTMRDASTLVTSIY